MNTMRELLEFLPKFVKASQGVLVLVGFAHLLAAYFDLSILYILPSFFISLVVVFYFWRRRVVADAYKAQHFRNQRTGIESCDSEIKVEELKTSGLDAAIRARRSKVELGKGEFD
jgi:hypothetical protein